MDIFSDKQMCVQTCTEKWGIHPKCNLEHPEGWFIMSREHLNYLRSEEACDGRLPYECKDGKYSGNCAFKHPENWVKKMDRYNKTQMESIELQRKTSSEVCKSCRIYFHPLCVKNHEIRLKKQPCNWGSECRQKDCFFDHTN